MATFLHITAPDDGHFAASRWIEIGINAKTRLGINGAWQPENGDGYRRHVWVNPAADIERSKRNGIINLTLIG